FESSSIDGPSHPIFTSINEGTAGLAYGLYRMACATDDAELFALADIWSSRSAVEVQNDAPVVRQSLYYGSSGALVVQALLAGARGDASTQHAATRAYIDASRQPSTILNLVL